MCTGPRAWASPAASAWSSAPWVRAGVLAGCPSHFLTRRGPTGVPLVEYDPLAAAVGESGVAAAVAAAMARAPAVLLVDAADLAFPLDPGPVRACMHARAQDGVHQPFTLTL